MAKILMRHVRHYFLIGLSVVGLGTAAILPASARPFEVPPINSPATAEHRVGKIIWLDLETTDLASAKKFYAGLFHWHFRDYHAEQVDYAVAMQGDHAVAGILQRRIRKGKERASAWLPFIAARDVDAAVTIALQHHAQIDSEPENLPLRGRQALLTDPEGVRFGILASSSGDPSDTAAAPGAWLWTALVARDSADEAVFYQQVFGYTLLGMSTNTGFERVRLSSDGQARISVSEMPSDASSQQPYWIQFVRVANATDAVTRALKLGGRVILNVQRNDRGDQSAVLADPTGARFGITEPPNPAIATPMP
jgi:predicted enzyme related to lactoylglutathione lyase